MARQVRHDRHGRRQLDARNPRHSRDVLTVFLVYVINRVYTPLPSELSLEEQKGCVCSPGGQTRQTVGASRVTPTTYASFSRKTGLDELDTALEEPGSAPHAQDPLIPPSRAHFEIFQELAATLQRELVSVRGELRSA